MNRTGKRRRDEYVIQYGGKLPARFTVWEVAQHFIKKCLDDGLAIGSITRDKAGAP